MADGSSRYTSHAERHRLTVSAGWPARTDRLGLSIGRTPVSEKEQLRCGFELAWLTEAADTPAGTAKGDTKHMKMYLISDNVDTYTGMRLAGVDGVVVHEREELREALENVLSDKSVGIVLLTEKFGREFPDIIDTFRLERKMPLLVEIPDRHGTGRKKDFITSYITEAIGLKL